MRNYITLYLENINERLNEKITDDDILELKEKILYFQHERLIHLLVTMTFAFFTIVFLVLGMVSWLFLIPFVIFLVFDLFYIIHYYFLENSVQTLYTLEDKMIQKRGQKL